MDDETSKAMLLSSIDFNLMDRISVMLDFLSYLHEHESDLEFLLSDDLLRKLRKLGQNAEDSGSSDAFKALREKLSSHEGRLFVAEFTIQTLKYDVSEIQKQLETIRNSETLTTVATLIRLKTLIRKDFLSTLESLQLGASYSVVDDDEILSIQERDLYGIMGMLSVHGDRVDNNFDSLQMFDNMIGVSASCTSTKRKQPDQKSIVLFTIDAWGERFSVTIQDVREYDTVCIFMGRHITSITFGDDSLLLVKYVRYFTVKHFKATSNDGLPSTGVWENAREYSREGQWTQKVSAFPKVKVEICTSNVILYQLCPMIHLANYTSPQTEAKLYTEYIGLCSAASYLLSTLDSKLDDSLEMSLSTSKSDIEFLVLYNTSSIQYILNELQYIPKYVPFKLDKMRFTGTLTFEKPLLNVAGEMMSMVGYAPEEYYVGDGMVSFDITPPNAHNVPRIFSAATYQTINAQIPVSYASEFLLIDESEYSIYLSYKVFIDHSEKVYGGMHQLSQSMIIEYSLKHN